jgi:para-aminobenzoate synthetase component 1
VAMRIDRLGDLGNAPDVLCSIAAAGQRLGLAPPAALIGDWFGSRAVIAPTVNAAAVATDHVFGSPDSSGPPGSFDSPDSSGPPGSPDGPVVGGGWIGYLSYPDAGADGAQPRIPAAAGGWTDCVLRQGRDGQWWYESLSGGAMAPWVQRALVTPVRRGRCDIAWGEPDRDRHRAGVEACLKAIASGEVYQACVCTHFTGSVHGAPIDFFADAVAGTQPSRAAYIAGPWGAVASLSPELFLRRSGAAQAATLDTGAAQAATFDTGAAQAATFDTVTSSPIKGTLPRHASPSALAASVKDVAENIMIVDLVRNDLGRVAATGSVRVPELLAVRPAPGVWHLVSTVTAKVPAELSMTELLEATFPPGSVTGTPKARARRLLSGWEPHRRGVYCGTVGLASPIAGCELNVAIRTVEFDAADGAILGVGGGITADSNPDDEWVECLHKAAPIVGSALTTAVGTAR